MATGFINDPKAAGSMTYDYVHPNKAGQLFMMERWYNAIMQNLHDDKPPTLKGKPRLNYIDPKNITVSWGAADDNYGIKSYDILINGKVASSTSKNTLSYVLKDLRRKGNYKIGVRANDWSGNKSNAITTNLKLK
jgi:hypothetical protein